MIPKIPFRCNVFFYFEGEKPGLEFPLEITHQIPGAMLFDSFAVNIQVNNINICQLHT